MAVAQAQQEAENQARQSLGQYSRRVESFDWSGSDEEMVRLRVRATTPRMLLGLDRAIGLDTIDRRIALRTEELN